MSQAHFVHSGYAGDKKTNVPRKYGSGLTTTKSNIAKSQLVTKRQVRDMLRAVEGEKEQKYKDLDLIGTGVSDIGLVSDLTAIAQAVNVNSRVGDIVQISAIDFRMTLTIGDTTNVGRVIIFQWMPNTIPVLGQILQNAGVNYVTSQYQGSTPELYCIMFDTGPFMLSGSYPIKCISQHLTNMKSKFIQFQPTLTTGAGKLYAAFVTDSTVIPTPLMSFESRIWFTDD